MIMVLSKNYETFKKRIKEAKELCSSTMGDTREDDERLGELDDLLTNIEQLIQPATDDR